jgi:large subunit ribosomal protein L21
MFAVIKTGGKQYKVAKDDVIFVEKLDGDAGALVRFDDVLMVGDGARQTVGKPLVEGAAVTATVLEQTRGEKVLVFKKRRRKRYKRMQGHRQHLTVLRVTDILPTGAKRKVAAIETTTQTEEAEAAAAEITEVAAGAAAAAEPAVEAKEAAPKRKAAPKKAATGTAADAPKKKAAPKKKPATKKATDETSEET